MIFSKFIISKNKYYIKNYTSLYKSILITFKKKIFIIKQYSHIGYDGTRKTKKGNIFLFIFYL
jgi:hypothetical protein